MIALPAKADIVTYNFTAKIETLTEYTNSLSNPMPVSNAVVRGENLSLGNAVKGSFTYDTTTRRASSQPEPKNGQVSTIYSDSFAANTLNFTFDKTKLNFHFNNDSFLVPEIHVENGSYDSLSYIYSTLQDSIHNFVKLSFSGSGDIFSDTALPATIPLDKINYDPYDFYYVFSDYSGTSRRILKVRGQFSSVELVSITPVPEPRGYLMLLAGLAGVGLIARRRQVRR
ncbi:PEP-CTERM sorting domain-containing protein [Massilia sp. NR 4-1]|uniref:PEP-CTERM sorting domain-containing protein n=1 Tax=Massilia sp. NR 4-1 TaxID=1678028 RepID=UPI001CC1A687|nr:PEP-CTERM sorting domain-containing protein [Massilia sp. NR 4-1]